MSKVPALAIQISHHAGLDSAHTPTATADETGAVAEPHESHDWQPYPADSARPRWVECASCGMRDYYPGAAEPCQAVPSVPGRRRARVERPATLGEALTCLARDLDEFAAWWRARPELGDMRPSTDEWAAEFTEWRKGDRR